MKKNPLNLIVPANLFSFPILSLFAVITCVGLAVADVTLGTVSQFTVGFDGALPAGNSGSPETAPNGRLVAFRSDATNLVNDGFSGQSQIYLRDFTNGALTRASINSSGQAANDYSDQPAISSFTTANNFAVAFRTAATNLGSITPSGLVNNIYVNFYFSFPTTTKIESITELVSRDVNGAEPDGDSANPTVALLPLSNKVIVAYSSAAEDLVVGDTNKLADIFYTSFSIPKKGSSISLGATVKISKSSTGGATDGSCITPRLSGNGSFLVFACSASNIISSRTPASTFQIYLYEFASDQTTLISKNTSSVPGDNDSLDPRISYSGRYIVYSTFATNVTADSSGSQRVVLFDRLKNSSTLVELPISGTEADGFSQLPSISPDGRFVSFASTSTNLITGDTNGFTDVFLKDLQKGTTQRVSLGDSGVEGDSASDISALATTGFSGLSGVVSFRSFATNLTSAPASSSIGSIFGNSLTFQAPTLSNETILEVPPDLQAGKKRVKATMQSFSDFSNTSSAIAGSNGSLTAPATINASTINYDIRLDSTKKKKDRFKLVSRRNQVTFRNVPRGTYTSRYRTVVKDGKKVIGKTDFSPKQIVTVK